MEDDKLWVLRQPLLKVMLKIGLPVSMMEALRLVYNIIDTYWLGNYNSILLSGLAVSWPVIFLVTSAFLGVYGAGISLTSQYWGAKKFDMSMKVAGQLLFFTLAVSPLMAIAIVVATPALLALIGAPPEASSAAYSYIFYIALGSPVFGILESIVALYTAVGLATIPMIFRGIGTLLNIFLDPVFIYGMYGVPEMGISGAAIATVLSEFVAAVIGLAYFVLRGVKGEKMSFVHLLPDKELLKKIIEIGLPLSGSALADASGFYVLSGVIGMLGEEALASWTIGDRPFGIVSTVITGLLTACSTIIGQSLGAGLYDKAKEAAKKVLAFSIAITAVFVTPLVVFRNHIATAFAPDNPTIASYAADFMLFMGPSLLFFSMLTTARFVASGSGHTRPIMYLSFLRLWGLRNILAYLFGPGPIGMGVSGLWIGMALSNVITGLVAVCWILRYSWLKPVIR